MSLNSSSLSNHTSPLSSFTTIHELLQKCLSSSVGTYIMTAFATALILFLLPVCVFVLYLGHQRYRQLQANASLTHSDVFTFHMVSIELMNIVGAIFCCCGDFAGVPKLVLVGIYLFSVVFIAQLFFHVLTCVERYVAVVHPVIYIRLKSANAIRFRNGIIGLLWILSFVGTGVMSLSDHSAITIGSYCIVSCAIVVIAFCSLSVLCVLVRQGPGDGGKDRQRVDQMKLRAFYTIMAILGVLVLRFAANFYSNVLYDSEYLGEVERCGLWASKFWFCFPSSLVLPLLFLQREGKLKCCQRPPPDKQ